MANQNFISKINGVDIITVNKDGETYVPIKPICQALGIDDKTQRDKIQEDEFFASVGGIIPSTGSDGKRYDMFCIRLRDVYGWLFSVDTNLVAEERRELVEKYQLECYQALYNHFAGSLRQRCSDPQISSSAIF